MRDKIFRLLFSSEPLPDESFMGYFLRLTEKNRCETPSWLLSKARIKSYVRAPLNFLFDNSQDFSPLSALTGVGEEKLKMLPYLPADGVRRKMGDYLFFRWPVHRCLIRPRRPKICPGCLREFGYVRKVWEFALVTACPLHKCLLLDACPNCGKPIPWIRRRVSVCRCDFDWRGYRSVPLPDSEYEVTRRVHSLCGLPGGGGEPPEDLKIADSPLYGLGLQPFVSALTFVVSQFAQIPLKNNRQRYLDLKGISFRRSHTNAEAHALLRRAQAVFEDWPKNYYSFLDERRAEIESAVSKRAGGNPFRRYQSALFLRLPSQDFAFVRSAFREYQRIHRFEVYIAVGGGESKAVGENTKDAVPPPNVGDVPALAQANGGIHEIFEAHVSVSKACKVLRIGRAGVERLIASGTLKAMAGINGEDRIFFIEKASLERLKSKLEQSLGLRQAAGLLGVRDSRVRDMVRCSFLHPLRGPGADGSPDWRFDRAEVASLLDRLVGGVPKKQRVDRRKFVDCITALKIASHSGVGLGTFLLAVLDGELKPAGKADGIGLPSLLFSKNQVVRYARSEFQLLAGGAMTAPEVAKTLGVGAGAVYFLIKKGILRSRQVEGLPLSRRLISRDEFDAFNETYLSASKIASEHQTGWHHLIRSLAARGIHPVTGRKIDGGYIYLYRRADIAALNIAAVIAEERKTRLIISKPPSTVTSESKEAKATKRPKTKRRYYKPPPILNETQAAEILGVDVETLRQLVEAGALRPHSRLPRPKGKGGKYLFSSYAVEKYKDRVSDYTGLVSFAAVAEMFNICPENFHKKFIKTGRLKPVLNGVRRGDHFFRLNDVEALAEIDKRTILTSEAAEILGVNISGVGKMIAAGDLAPVSGPNIDGFGHNLLLRDDVEKLREARDAFKAERIKEGKTPRYGRGPRHPRPALREIISPRIVQLIALWKRQDPHRPVSGRELHQQLVREGHQVGIVSVHVALRKIRQQVA